MRHKIKPSKGFIHPVISIAKGAKNNRVICYWVTESWTSAMCTRHVAAARKMYTRKIYKNPNVSFGQEAY